MAPLDLLDSNQKVSYYDKLSGWCDKLKSANVDGIMIDVWWGLVEKTAGSYNFDGYSQLFKLFKDKGLKIIPVMSFHQCGGNVGDTCNIPLPSFVTSSTEQPFFIDGDGHVDKEYISFAYDNEKVGGRTPIDMYKGVMKSFASTFASYIKEGIISSVEIGLGPCGESRYPSYQLAYWNYPGCGEFQSYDAKFTAKLKADADAAGKSSFGHNPTNVGGYNTKPGESSFWKDDSTDGWISEYGQWFIKWYSKQLCNHAQNVLKVARDSFGSARLSAKIAGIHWWYMTSSHCSETTAGFDNFYFYNGYRDLATVFKMYDADICFTCLEMTAGGSGSNPPALVQQVLDAANWAGLEFEGENALAVYDSGSYSRIVQWAKKGLSTFTYLRLCDDLMYDNNFNTFKQFVNDMHNA